MTVKKIVLKNGKFERKCQFFLHFLKKTRVMFFSVLIIKSFLCWHGVCFIFCRVVGLSILAGRLVFVLK